ncbi:MAG TPA: HNH endonuclease [Acidiphilium sp.]|nr:HNH endonuclease [Acidiphilium sp.]
MAKVDGAKKRLLAHFLANIGRVMDGDELRPVANNRSEWARRVRELRDEQGYQILSHTDRADLKPGQYVMISPERKEAAERAISKETRARVLEVYGSICYVCGAIAGEPNPANGRATALHMGHIKAKSHGGDDTVSNLRPVCMVCNTGASNITAELPSAKRMIAELRKAPRAEQLEQHPIRWNHLIG